LTLLTDRVSIAAFLTPIIGRKHNYNADFFLIGQAGENMRSHGPEVDIKVARRKSFALLGIAGIAQIDSVVPIQATQMFEQLVFWKEADRLSLSVGEHPRCPGL